MYTIKRISDGYSHKMYGHEECEETAYHFEIYKLDTMIAISRTREILNEWGPDLVGFRKMYLETDMDGIEYLIAIDTEVDYDRQSNRTDKIELTKLSELYDINGLIYIYNKDEKIMYSAYENRYITWGDHYAGKNNVACI